MLLYINFFRLLLGSRDTVQIRWSVKTLSSISLVNCAFSRAEAPSIITIVVSIEVIAVNEMIELV